MAASLCDEEPVFLAHVKKSLAPTLRAVSGRFESNMKRVIAGLVPATPIIRVGAK
jgi:hypothetical protein